MSDTVPLSIRTPPFSTPTKPAIPSLQHLSAQLLCRGRRRPKEEKGIRGAPQKISEIQSCSSQTDHGFTDHGSRPRPALSPSCCQRVACSNPARHSSLRTTVPDCLGPLLGTTSPRPLEKCLGCPRDLGRCICDPNRGHSLAGARTKTQPFFLLRESINAVGRQGLINKRAWHS